METEPPDVSHLFFQYLREANWHNLLLNPESPEQALFEFLVQDHLPIYLGILEPEHGTKQIGLLTHPFPMNATVFPQDEPQMREAFGVRSLGLAPPHFLGAIIKSRGRDCPGNKRIYTQLGTVMVRSDSLRTWSSTNFVFAAELDEHGRAALLWMLEKSGNPTIHTHSHDTALQQYPFFDLRTMANLPEPRPHSQVLLELRCGQAGWREQSEAKGYVGVGLTELMYHASPQQVHFVTVVQLWTGHLRHATLFHRNPAGTAGLSSADLSSADLSTPSWVCAWCPHPQTDFCPHLNGTIV